MNMSSQKKEKENICCDPEKMDTSCCRVESVVTIDGKGQIYFSKDLREAAGINTGDKFAVVSMKKKGEVCCLSLIKVEHLGGMVRNFLGPMVQDLNEE
jgi:antitoxin PrlF